MSVLVALMPPPARSAPAGAAGAAVDAGPLGSADWKWALSTDGRQISSQGETSPALWPRADALVLVCPPQALGWVWTDLPKVPASRLRAALAGALEEALLDDPQDLHFALPPTAKPGKRCVVAAMNRSALQQALQAVEAAGREIDRVVPGGVPCADGAPPQGHFQVEAGEEPASCRLVWADTQGVACLRVDGDGARFWVQQALDRPARPGSDSTDSQRVEPSQARTAVGSAAVMAEQVVWTAAPAAVAQAEAWLGRPVPVVAEAQRWLEAAAAHWELRQFELAPRHRGLRMGREAWRRFMGPAWRPVRWGLVGLLAANVLGLHAWAWSQQQAVEQRRQAQAALLKTTHPQVRVVLDAPLQMTREAERLREAAGQPGEADLEAALAAAAAAWPAGLAHAQTLRYERAELTLTVAGISPAQVSAMNERLQPLGWRVEASGGRLNMTRRAGASGR